MKQELPDLVYVLGRPALWGHNELRFSIRSAEKYLKFNRLFIYGYKPTFINSKTNVIFMEDDKGHKYKNVAYKVKTLLKDENLSENIIYMNDDFFLLKEYEKIPYLWNKKIKEWVDKYPEYKGKYYNNICKLYESFPEGKFFETHFPIIYNRKKAVDVIEKYNLDITLMLRSYYSNEYEKKLDNIEESKDYKIKNVSELNEFVKNGTFISCSNMIATSSEFKRFLMTKFSKPSSYESSKQNE
jgi:hypothetical protein